MFDYVADLLKGVLVFYLEKHLVQYKLNTMLSIDKKVPCW